MSQPRRSCRCLDAALTVTGRMKRYSGRMSHPRHHDGVPAHDELPLTSPAPNAADLEALALHQERIAAPYQRLADESNGKARLLRLQAAALRALDEDDRACRAVMALSHDGWTGSSEDLVSVARSVTAQP